MDKQVGETREIDGVTLHLARPVDGEARWIGRDEVLKQLLACWLTVGEGDFPLAPRLTGPPGDREDDARHDGRRRAEAAPVYLPMHGRHPAGGPARHPRSVRAASITYQASPLVTAMLNGGVCVLDEGNRMNEKSWASLAPLLDHRRYAESIVAGVRIKAHPDFRCAVTMNEDESTFEIPDYILSRLQPTLSLGHPEAAEEKQILEYHLPFADAEMLALTVEFLQRAHGLKLEYSTRDGINVLRYATKRLQADTEHPLSKHAAWKEALLQCLGDDAADLERLAEQKSDALGGANVPMGLADFFFDPNSPLRPGQEDDPFGVFGGDDFDSDEFDSDDFDDPDDPDEGEDWKNV